MWAFASKHSFMAVPELPPQITRANTAHELGQALDELDGLRPMTPTPPHVRVPPPFPLTAYLVMKRTE